MRGCEHNKKRSKQVLLEKFEKKLTYYRNVLNAFDYAETLAGILARVEEHKGKLVLSTTQHEGLKGSLNDALRKINKAEYVQIREERKALWATQKTSIQETEETSQEKELTFAKAGDTDIFESCWKKRPREAISLIPVSFVKGAGTLVKRESILHIENPMQTITMGLAFQAAAVAARSSFSSPQLHKIQKIGIVQILLILPTYLFNPRFYHRGRYSRR